MRAYSRPASLPASTLSGSCERPRGALQARADASEVVQRMRGLQGLAARAAPGPFEAVRAAVAGLSGQLLDDVAIHRNSSRPATKSALAFATRDAVELGPGQDHAIGHELWHVAQQRAGRVRADARLADGTAINADARLEHEADTMGARAVSLAGQAARTSTIASTLAPASTPARASATSGAAPVLQGLFTRDVARAKVSVDWRSRSAAYRHILGEFQRWHGGVKDESTLVRHEFLQRLLESIDRYVAAKTAKQQNQRRAHVLAGMAELRADVVAELAGLGAAVPSNERVYVAGGEAALEEDRTLRGGITHGRFRGMDRVDSGEGGLEALEEGATVHVYGHANYGTAIGSKTHKLDPTQLVDALLADGLEPERPVVIRLFACGSGAGTQAGGHYARNSTSFAQRMAERMATRGFTHATVIGYGHYMMPVAYPDAPLGKGRVVFDDGKPIHNDAANILPLADREVVWVVRAGHAQQTTGEAWVASNPKGERYEINLAQ